MSYLVQKDCIFFQLVPITSTVLQENKCPERCYLLYQMKHYICVYHTTVCMHAIQINPLTRENLFWSAERPPLQIYITSSIFLIEAGY